MQSSVSLNEVSEFNILNIELSVPVQYFHKRFVFSFSPVLALPQSSATIVTEDAVFEEDLENTFYFSAGISYFFIPKKKK
jgi:hypothetical protein